MRSKISLFIFFTGLICVVGTYFLATALYSASVKDRAEASTIEDAYLFSDYYELLHNTDALSMFSTPSHTAMIFSPEGELIFGEGDTPLFTFECELAKTNEYSVTSRFYETADEERMYCAMLLHDGNILRISRPYLTMGEFFSEWSGIVALILIAIIGFLLLPAVFLAKNVVAPILAKAPEGALPQSAAAYPEFRPFINELSEKRLQLIDAVDMLDVSTKRMNALMDIATGAMYYVDERGYITLGNKMGEDYFGNIVGRPYESAIKDDRITSAIMSSLSGQPRVDSTSISDMDVKIICSPIMVDERPRGALCAVYKTDDSAKIRQLKQELTANVSHELKTPLTSISGYAEMIASGIAKQEDVAGFATRIYKEAKRMLVLISDIIKLSKLDSADGPEMSQDIELYSMGEECLDLLSEAAERHDVTLHIKGSDSHITGNNIMVNELMYNLMDNAIRYNKPKGKVILNVMDKSFEVSDEGIGISKENQSQIFERFFRVDKSRSKETGGTGLGLAIVKHIAEIHGASIQIESELGQGTSITVKFK